MTKVVPYDAKGTVLRFEAWNRVKNREGAVYAPTDEFKNAKKLNIVLMTKVVPYDAKGTVLRFEAWNRVKNWEGAVYAPVPQKLYQQLPKHSNIC